jgi:hypothetical protein
VIRLNGQWQPRASSKSELTKTHRQNLDYKAATIQHILPCSPMHRLSWRVHAGMFCSSTRFIRSWSNALLFCVPDMLALCLRAPPPHVQTYTYNVKLVHDSTAQSDTPLPPIIW